MARTTSRGGDMNVYTALLFVTTLVLLAGVGVLALANMKQAEAGGQAASPFTVIR
ncbi:MAG: hypothetical protein ACKO0W_04430 [Planctomycetota bacterium]